MLKVAFRYWIPSLPLLSAPKYLCIWITLRNFCYLWENKRRMICIAIMNPLMPVLTLFSHRNNIVLGVLSSPVQRQRVNMFRWFHIKNYAKGKKLISDVDILNFEWYFESNTCALNLLSLVRSKWFLAIYLQCFILYTINRS